MTADEVDDWFVTEVLPLEAMLERYLRRHWRQEDDIADLRQEIYTRMFVAGRLGRPDCLQALLLVTARNLLIDKARRARIVSIETFADIEAAEHLPEPISSERYLMARSELRHLQTALMLLPPRCREVIELRKIEGLSQREVARKMGITEDTVERQLSKGIRILAAALADTGDGVAAPGRRVVQVRGERR